MTFEPVFEQVDDRPIYIAGPCSAENEDQVLRIANGLKDRPVDLFRAGIWKPRTRPGSFEGVGAIGLPWLQRVKKEYGLRVTTEVAQPHHVESALAHDIDVFWIGARTTVNPFLVEELAQSLAGVDIPILIKNPVNPDLKLWIGAIERFYNAGLKKIAAIHRGFSAYKNVAFRNPPMWQIPLDLMLEFPDLKVLCDHSHICGRRDTLKSVAQRALDLNFHGFMTEVHDHPDAAWSDAAQQITPAVYADMMDQLQLRKGSIESIDEADRIARIRREIDDLDAEVLESIGTRMKLVESIGSIKKEHDIPIYQPDRWTDVLRHSIKQGTLHQLSDEFILALYEAIHQESINRQSGIMNNG